MPSSLRPRSVYDILAVIGCLGALTTGTAYAANTIFSTDIVDGEVKMPDVATNAITASKVANGTLTSLDIAPETLSSGRIFGLDGTDIDDNSLAALQLAPNSVATSELAGNAVTSAKIADGSITSGDVLNDTLDGSDINEAGLNLNGFFAAASGTGGCTADTGTLTSCASTSITLPRPGKLLVNGTGEWHTFNLDDVAGPGSATDDASRVRGRCLLRVDGVQIGSSQSLGERQQSGVAANHPEGAQMALTALSGVVSAALHTVEIACTEEDGDMDWSQMNLTAVLVDD